MAVPSADLQPDLRRRYAEDAAGKRRRLPANLRQLGARGAVTQPTPGGAIVRIQVTGAGGTGRQLQYLQYDKQLRQRQYPLYGPGAENQRAFVQRAQHDPHQYHLFVSTKEDHLGAQRQGFIEVLVRQMERDLGRQLDWVAANHYDTEHPHSHIVVRGVVEGEELYMARGYFEHGIRDRANQLLHRMLGPQQQRLGYAPLQRYAEERLAMNGMVRGGEDMDTRRLVQQVRPREAQALAGQFGSYRQTGVEELKMQYLRLQHQTQHWEQQQRLHQQQGRQHGYGG